MDLLKRIFQIILAFILILFDLILFLSLINQTKTAANIISGVTQQLQLNPSYWTYGLSFQGQVDIYIFFTLMILNFILSMMCLFLAIKLFRNQPGKKTFVLGITVIFLLTLFINLWKANNSIREEEKSKDNLLKMVKNVDKKTVDNLSIIWYLKEPILCKNMKTTSMLISCMGGFNNINLFTPDYCDVLKDKNEINLCLSVLSEKQKNKDICNLITDESSRNRCLQKTF
ncbi:hypothetical protein COV87_00165 [Candidatus Roizmanbacteria bacterium CG11_big_fil_rev_8_21_14_0_20_37_16]|uniref:Uncharacterized protein n=1 Tax=Candidatus Roizmanbacteria bacterium CG11_big_fil_rev_8_21_14_0_20_37_16 TaxID=1974857 RepID=A0A2H0KLA6_9BACT|nr:MAG: hypothetical protein COV87_00165 [Candidatus Roizmanbacteria bacterium CG11_big_fil_rev_8_21_14_0_20_37_16]